MRKLRTGSRRQSGVTSIAELGPTLWIVFIVMTFPLLSFGTLGLRYCLVNNAVAYAAEAASQSNTFSINEDSAHLSSINEANFVMSKAAAFWSGVTVNTVTTSIVTSKLSSGAVSSQPTVLTSAQMAQQSSNIYVCQVAANVSLQPLFPQNYWHGCLASVPGLNAPIVTTVISSRLFENTGGLNK